MRMTGIGRWCFMALVCLMAGTSVAVESPDGFVVWSEGGHQRRELKYVEIMEGVGTVSGTKKTLVNRGTYADIECVISFDGKWVAFARQVGNGNRGLTDDPGDYHYFGNYDIYVARIDGSLPATPRKVGHGYWPSWGDDSDGPTKTLYYSWASGSHGGELKIMKATIESDGTVSQPRVHLQGFGSSGDAHMQCSPDGKKVAYRSGGNVVVYFAQQNRTITAGGGCHPCWGPDSYWLMWARRKVGAFDNGERIWSGQSGLHDYHYNFSNDGKWIIGRIGSSGNDQNTDYPIIYYPVAASEKGRSASWQKSGSGVTVGRGTWCDIHVVTGPSISVGSESGSIAVNKSVTLALSMANGATGDATWSLSGGGTLSNKTNTGATFTSDGTEGSFIVTARVGELESATTITVYDPTNIHLRINCGGGSVPEWESDATYASGGRDYSFSTSFSTSGIENAAPADVYKTVRHSEDHSFSFPSIPDGNYTVRIHFSDAGDTNRKMQYLIEGQTVLEGFDPPDNVITVKEYTVTVSDGDGLQIEAKKTTGNDIFEAGIEVIAEKSGTSTTERRARIPRNRSPYSIERATDGRVQIAVQYTRPYTIALIDVSGAVVGTIAGNQPGSHRLPGRGAAGVYIVRLRCNSEIQTQRLLIR